VHVVKEQVGEPKPYRKQVHVQRGASSREHPLPPFSTSQPSFGGAARQSYPVNLSMNQSDSVNYSSDWNRSTSSYHHPPPKDGHGGGMDARYSGGRASRPDRSPSNSSSIFEEVSYNESAAEWQ
jgi:hypothetical protein